MIQTRLQSSGYNNSNNNSLISIANDVYDLVYNTCMLHQDESTLKALAM